MANIEMHPVIKHLLARAERKVPLNDGRKIGLVLPGGMMTGVNGAAAVTALQELGLAQSFDVIYTASAGFPNASYLLSENTEVGSSVYYDDLCGDKFIHFWKVWEPVSFDVVVSAIRDSKPLNLDKIWNSATGIVLRLSDYSNARKERRYIHLKDYKKEEYFNLLKAAISSPVLSRCTKIHLKKMCDGHITNKDIVSQIQYALDSDCTDILVVYNQEVQKDLLSLPKADRYFEITPNGPSKISLFETRADVLKKAHSAMKELVLSIFRS